MSLEHPEHEVNVAFVGKYVDLTESYKSLTEALVHAGIHTRSKVRIHYLDSEEIERNGAASLAAMDAILVPGGFGKRGTEGKIAAIRYAREHKVPYLGICLGMQLAIIEFARHVAGLDGANSTEFDQDTPHPVVALITEWLDREGKVEQRDANSNLGGTMRLGAQRCPTKAGTLAAQVYGKEVNERHRHRYEVNNVYVPKLEAAGMVISARTPTENLPRDDGAVAGDPSVVRRRAVPPGIHQQSAHRPSAVHRLREGGAGAQGRSMKLCDFEVGLDQPLFLIAGPCVAESKQLCLDIAGQMKEICAELGIPYIFKASYDKANRSSGKSFRGLGIDEGLRDPCRGEEADRRAGADRRACRGRSGRRSRPWSMSCRRRPSCAGRPISSRPSPPAASR